MQQTVTIIGGGTGSFNLLTGLRAHDNLSIRSIVTMMDSGGDSGRLRDEFGVLPPGDLRRCLVALSEDSPLMRQLFSFRFTEEPLQGRHFGNLFFLALTKILGSEREAIKAIGGLLNIRGRVLPITWDNVHLHAELTDGSVVTEEKHIDVPQHDATIPIKRVYLAPEADANPEALQAIADSDFVVLAPGDLFTSSLPNLLVRGVPEALQGCRGSLVYVLNLMTKHGETNGFSASRHVDQIIRYGGRVPDALLVHRGHIPEDMILRYRAEEAHRVVVDEDSLARLGVRIIKSAAIMSTTSLVRHDPARTAAAMMELFSELSAARP